MAKGDFLGEFEIYVMLALAHLDPDAYGVTIRQITRRTGRRSRSVRSTPRCRGWRRRDSSLTRCPIRCRCREAAPGKHCVDSGRRPRTGPLDAHARSHDAGLAPADAASIAMPPIPRVVRWLLRLAAGPSYRDVVADLEEEAAARASTDSPAAARRWIRAQVTVRSGCSSAGVSRCSSPL